jgi:hypothetical protein
MEPVIATHRFINIITQGNTLITANFLLRDYIRTTDNIRLKSRQLQMRLFLRTQLRCRIDYILSHVRFPW